MAEDRMAVLETGINLITDSSSGLSHRRTA